MKCLVDAGPIVRVMGVSPRDCVLSALVDLNGRARFPIDVMVVGTGDVYRFVEKPTRGATEWKKFPSAKNN